MLSIWDGLFVSLAASCKFSCVLHPGSFRMPGLCLVFAGFASVFPTHKRTDMTNLEAATDGLPTPQAGGQWVRLNNSLHPELPGSSNEII